MTCARMPREPRGPIAVALVSDQEPRHLGFAYQVRMFPDVVIRAA
jgi:hypothetical protein